MSDCTECDKGESITMFSWQGVTLGIEACDKHATEFIAGHPEFSEWNNLGCPDCAQQFIRPNGIYYYRVQFKDGWMSAGFIGCPEHVTQLFGHLGEKK